MAEEVGCYKLFIVLFCYQLEIMAKELEVITFMGDSSILFSLVTYCMQHQSSPGARSQVLGGL